MNMDSIVFPCLRGIEYWNTATLDMNPNAYPLIWIRNQRRNVNIEASTTLQEVLVVAGTGVDQGLSFERSRNSNYELSKDFLQNVPGLGGEKRCLAGGTTFTRNPVWK